MEFALRILVPRPLNSFESGNLLLKALAKHLPAHLPTRYGAFEPLTKIFMPEQPDLALEEWGKSYFLASNAEGALLQVGFGAPKSVKPRHVSIAFSFRSEGEEETSGVAPFVYEICEAFRADYAMAHILTDTELRERLAEKLLHPTSPPEPPVEQIVEKMRDAVRRKGFASVLEGLEIVGLGTHRLTKYLPDLYWLNVFGLPYVEVFGHDKLRTAPAEEVVGLSYGGVAVKLTSAFRDSTEAWNEFKTVREKCKLYLDSNVFFDPAAPSKGSYRVPTFRFPAEMYKQPIM
jgi:hypothetical protein